MILELGNEPPKHQMSSSGPLAKHHVVMYLCLLSMEWWLNYACRLLSESIPSFLY